MKNVLTLVALALVLVCATALEAQGRSPYRRNQNEYKRAADKNAENLQKQAKNAGKKNEQEEREAEREAAKEEREQEREAKRGQGNNAGDAEEPEYVPQPGEVVEKALKEEIIDEWMDDLGLTDKAQRDKFKRNVRGAWEDNEKEDKRYAAAYKKATTIEKMDAEKKNHKEKLTKIWEESDAKLLKEKAVNDDQLAKWKEMSTELRTKTATDLYYEDLNKKNEEKTAKDNAKAEDSDKSPEKKAPEKKEKKDSED